MTERMVHGAINWAMGMAVAAFVSGLPGLALFTSVTRFIVIHSEKAL